LLSILLNH